MAHAREFERQALPHLDAAFTLAFWLMRSNADAEDVVQDAMLRAFRGFGGYSGEAFKPWLLAIVRNCAYRALARRRRSSNVISLDLAVTAHQDGEAFEKLEIRDEGPTPEENLLRTADKVRLDQAIASLPEAFREVVVLREVEDLSYREIASIVGAPVGTVMSRLARGRRLLAAEMKDDVTKDESHGL